MSKKISGLDNLKYSFQPIIQNEVFVSLQPLVCFATISVFFNFFSFLPGVRGEVVVGIELRTLAGTLQLKPCPQPFLLLVIFQIRSHNFA
jgi:hypothetical protein